MAATSIAIERPYRMSIVPKPEWVTWQMLTDLLHVCYKEHLKSGLHFSAAVQDVEITQKVCETGVCMVVLMDNELVGTCTYQKHTNRPQGKSYETDCYLFLCQVAVHPKWQGKKISQHLFSDIRDRNPDATAMVLDTAEPATGLIAYYRRLGFAIVDHIKWETTNYRSVIMMKDLRHAEKEQAIMASQVDSNQAYAKKPVAILITNMPQFYSVHPIMQKMNEEAIAFDIFVPCLSEDDKWKGLWDEVYDYLVIQGFSPLRANGREKYRYNVFLSPQYDVSIKADYTIRYRYSFITKPEWSLQFENCLPFDFILCYGNHDQPYFEAYAKTCVVGELKLLNFAKEERRLSQRKTLVYAPTYNNISNILAMSGVIAELKNDYYLVLKSHPGSHYLHEEQCAIAELESQFDLVYDDSAPLYELLRTTDILLSDHSGAIFDAIATSVPVAIVALDGMPTPRDGQPLHAELVKNGTIPAAFDVRDVAAALSSALTDEVIAMQRTVRSAIFSISPEEGLTALIRLVQALLSEGLATGYQSTRLHLFNTLVAYEKKLLEQRQVHQDDINALHNSLTVQQSAHNNETSILRKALEDQALLHNEQMYELKETLERTHKGELAASQKALAEQRQTFLAKIQEVEQNEKTVYQIALIEKTEAFEADKATCLAALKDQFYGINSKLFEMMQIGTAVNYWLTCIAASKPFRLSGYLVRLYRDFIRGGKTQRALFWQWFKGERKLGLHSQSDYVGTLVRLVEQSQIAFKQLSQAIVAEAESIDIKTVSMPPLEPIVSAQTAVPLNGYEYKFMRYLQKRDKQFRLDLSKVTSGSVKGLVSIVLPVYNGDDMVAESIESVLAQDYVVFELIIVNDGSTDETPAIINRYAQLDSRIRVIHQQNQKLPRALNNGFALARGEYCTWTSADNRMHATCLSKLKDFMDSNPSLAMCFGNMRLIDEQGDVITHNEWYANPMNPGCVYLPHGTLELNTYPNNTIGAAFMYRRTVIELIGGYDHYLYTVEDYDYWMRINHYFNIRHTDFNEPVYDYRFHDKSLTSQAKQLCINENRENLMVIEDFREEFNLRPLAWHFVGTHDTAWEAKVEACGHLLLDEKTEKICWPNVGSYLVQVVFCGGENLDSTVVRQTRDASMMLVFTDPQNASLTEGYDAILCLGKPSNSEGEIRGILYVDDINTACNIIQILAKAKLLRMMSELDKLQAEPTCQATIALCTYKRIDAAICALDAMINQSVDKQAYEILVINNDPCNKSIQLYIQDQYTRQPLPKDFIRYIECPFKGLSAARNCALYDARGEIVVYIDDDGIMQADCLQYLIDAFTSHPEAGAIGGQILLNQPERFESVILKGYETIWSERRIPGDQYVRAQYDYDFPFGCNFAVRRSVLRQLGGFRTTYGRVGKDYAGGEETVMCHQIWQLHMDVGLAPRAIVVHDVDPSRFTLEHVKQTIRASFFTNRLMKMDLYRPFDLGMKEENVRLQAIKDRLSHLENQDIQQTDLRLLYAQIEVEMIEQAIAAGKDDMLAMQINGWFRNERG